MLTKDEVRAAIRFQNPPRPPRAFTKWWGEGLWEQYGDQLKQFDQYEEDIVVVGFPCPAFTRQENGFYWRLPEVAKKGAGHDSNAALPNWEELPALLAELPESEKNTENLIRAALLRLNF